MTSSKSIVVGVLWVLACVTMLTFAGLTIANYLGVRYESKETQFFDAVRTFVSSLTFLMINRAYSRNKYTHWFWVLLLGGACQPLYDALSEIWLVLTA